MEMGRSALLQRTVSSPWSSFRDIGSFPLASKVRKAISFIGMS